MVSSGQVASDKSGIEKTLNGVISEFEGLKDQWTGYAYDGISETVNEKIGGLRDEISAKMNVLEQFTAKHEEYVATSTEADQWRAIRDQHGSANGISCHTFTDENGHLYWVACATYNEAVEKIAELVEKMQQQVQEAESIKASFPGGSCSSCGSCSGSSCGSGGCSPCGSGGCSPCGSGGCSPCAQKSGCTNCPQ